MLIHKYKDIIHIENILSIWERFLRGKRHKKDVMKFQNKLGDNLSKLYLDLTNKTYKHGPYGAFNISDPKPRNIHKASVRDRVVHHLIYRTLYQYFDDRFIFDSYSCRKHKGTHRALYRFKQFAGKVSKNYTKSCFVLKCDVRKFFASIDQTILIQILERHIQDDDIKWLINGVLESFYTTQYGVGLPLGNLTSQLLVNIYMHEFDMYIKQELFIKYYIRYADDFVILSDNKKYLEMLLPKINNFLFYKLKLTMHPDKVYIKTYDSGVDFLGWVHFNFHRQIRTTTKRKIVRNLKWCPKRESINSYRGLLNHGNTHKFKEGLNVFS